MPLVEEPSSIAAVASVVASRTESKVRLTFLDGARGLAAMLVLFEHAGYRFLPHFRSFTHNAFSFGKMGLVLFFLVSGFVIPMSLEKTGNLRQFWVHRVFRLYPLYWLSLAAILGLYAVGLSTELTPEFKQHLVRNAVLNGTMIEGLMRIPYAIGLYYTLTIEIAFYVACTLLVLLKFFKRSRLIAWVLLAGASLCWIGTPLLLHRRVEMAGLFYGLTLFVGTVVYRVYVGQISIVSLTRLLAVLGASTAVGIWLNYVVFKKNDQLEQYGYWAVWLPWSAAYAIFLVGYLLRSRSLPKVCLWFGTISYSLYLLHPLVLSLIAPGVQDFTSAPDWSNLFLLMAATVTIASATYLFVERPMISWSHRIVRSSKRPTIVSR